MAKSAEDLVREWRAQGGSRRALVVLMLVVAFVVVVAALPACTLLFCLLTQRYAFATALTLTWIAWHVARPAFGIWSALRAMPEDD